MTARACGWVCTRASRPSSRAVHRHRRAPGGADRRGGNGDAVLLSASTRELLGASADVRDVGRHRLRDLGEPVRLYQLGHAEFPPLRSLDATNLPVQPTPLVGREKELGEAGRLLRAHRVVTLTGPGGSGKTRLALQLAAEASDDFPPTASGWGRSRLSATPSWSRR